MKNIGVLLGVVFLVSTVPMLASGAEPLPNSAVCTLEDGRQVSLRYELDDHGSKLRMGQMWPQPDHPMLLFTQMPMRIEDSSIPIGAFSVYVIPDKKQWTLVVNRNVSTGEYHPQQDLVRASMVTGQISGQHTQYKIWFGHSGTNRCEFRFYNGNTGASVEFQEDSRTGS